MMRGWAKGIQGDDISSETKSRQRFEFWTLLGVLYLGMLLIFIYAHFFRPMK